MGKRIAYGKIARSMPLTLDKCGTLGGDVEMVAIVKEMALRHPEDTFYLFGRNTGERPKDVGLPENIVNPWTEWGWHDAFRDFWRRQGYTGSTSVREQLEIRDFYDDMTRDFAESLDGFVIWAGQHGTSNSPLPRVSKSRGNADPEITKTYDNFITYSSFLLRGINHWRTPDPFHREEVWLNADSRNQLKMRDLAWPLQHPVLTQYDFTHKIRHERYGIGNETLSHWAELAGAHEMTKAGNTLWQSTVTNVYSRLEINALREGTPFGDLISYDENFDRPGHFGLFINEARAYVNEHLARIRALKDYVLPVDPFFIHGTWSRLSLEDIGRTITSAPWSEYYPKLHSVKCTLTTPSSGSGFATTKPWEAFAAGTVCFFHPSYDDQNHILADAPDDLRDWLRVTSPEDFRERLTTVSSNETLWRWLIRAQRRHFDDAIGELQYMKMIEERIWP